MCMRLSVCSAGAPVTSQRNKRTNNQLTNKLTNSQTSILTYHYQHVLRNSDRFNETISHNTSPDYYYIYDRIDTTLSTHLAQTRQLEQEWPAS